MYPVTLVPNKQHLLKCTQPKSLFQNIHFVLGQNVFNHLCCLYPDKMHQFRNLDLRYRWTNFVPGQTRNIHPAKIVLKGPFKQIQSNPFWPLEFFKLQHYYTHQKKFESHISNSSVLCRHWATTVVVFCLPHAINYYTCIA